MAITGNIPYFQTNPCHNLWYQSMIRYHVGMKIHKCQLYSDVHQASGAVIHSQMTLKSVGSWAMATPADGCIMLQLIPMVLGSPMHPGAEMLHNLSNMYWNQYGFIFGVPHFQRLDLYRSITSNHFSVFGITCIESHIDPNIKWSSKPRIQLLKCHFSPLRQCVSAHWGAHAPGPTWCWDPKRGFPVRSCGWWH